jgi:hypothetical protein
MYTQDENGRYHGGSSVIPPSMQIATTGIYSATTYGFSQANATVIGGLIAPTVISLVSIIIVIVAIVTRNHEEPEDSRSFDPGNVLHLISAASAGGMHKATFPPFDEIKEDLFRDDMISLGPANGRIGFIDVSE